MAILNSAFYGGEDLYTDGDIEIKMLEIAHNNMDIDEMKDVSYPIIYHFSKMRQNIINWYPIDSDKSVLEIGSGCGAITSALCEKAAKVVSIELSKRRATINYERNRNYDNLEIIIGNMYDIEILEKFDYIVINGVMEYAMSFTKDGNPYNKFIEKVSELLSEQGKILLSIENRIGLKYFAGAPEDHTDTFFLGLNKYIGNDDVRTFSKSELRCLFENNGFKNIKFYYPFPDYKFPTEIFSEQSIFTNKYGRDYFNLNGNRFDFFNEAMMADTLTEEGVIDKFANSFFVEISREKVYEDRNIVYVKFSDDRGKEFQIATKIYEQNNRKYVVKSSMTENSNEHIKKIYTNSLTSISEKIKYLNAEMVDDGEIRYQYLENKSIDTVIREKLILKDVDGIYNIIDSFFGELEKSAYVDDYVNEEFVSRFGDVSIADKELCVKPGNIDLIFDNVFLDKTNYIVIDGEWIFNINVPVKFIEWRSINELYIKYAVLDQMIKKQQMLDRYNILDVIEYSKWHKFFCYNYIKANKIRKYNIAKTDISMNQLMNSIENKNKILSSLYIDMGDGFKEENKICVEAIPVDGIYIVKYDLCNYKEIKSLRWDPIELKYCSCKILSVEGIQGLSPMNSINSEDESDWFATFDPNYNVDFITEEDIHDVEIKFEMNLLDDKTIDAIITRYKVEQEEYMNNLSLCEQKYIYANSLYQNKKMENNLLCEEILHNKQTILEMETKLDVIRNDLENQINNIYNSRTWKLLIKIGSIKKKLLGR